MADGGRTARLVNALWDLAVFWRLMALGLIGALAALGQEPVGAWPITLVMLALVSGLFLGVQSWRRAAILGWAVGVGYFLLSLNWIVEPFFVDAPRDGWMAPFAVIGLASGLALFWAAGLVAGHLAGGGGSGFVAGFGGSEALRAYVLTGFPWAQPGHVLIDTSLLHFVSWFGALGLLALMLLGAVCLWRLGAGEWRKGAAGLICLVLLWPLGNWLRPDAAPRPDAQIIRLVQPNAPQNEKWNPDKVREFFKRQLMFSAAGEQRPDLVVWPETAVPVILNEAGPTLEAISDASGGVPVVLGIQRFDGSRLFNSLVLVVDRGLVAAVYDKHHLVPFGEYVPFGDWLADWGIHGMAAREGQGYSAGPGAQVIGLGDLGSALPLICYESVFPQDVAAAPVRADFMLLITNDAWFGDFSGPYQHFAQARLRSAEQGLPMIRVANTGVSGVIDATGKVLASIPLGKAGWLDVPLPPPLPPTVYSRLGDVPMVGFYVILLLFPAVTRRLGFARRM